MTGCSPTFLDGNGSNIALLVFHAHQLRLLDLPQRRLVGVGQTGKELEPERKELALVGIVESTSSLAYIRLLGIIDGESLVLDSSDGTDLAVTFVEDLFRIDRLVVNSSLSFPGVETYLGRSRLGVVHPGLPLLGKVKIGLVARVLEGLNEAIHSPQQLTIEGPALA